MKEVSILRNNFYLYYKVPLLLLSDIRSEIQSLICGLFTNKILFHYNFYNGIGNFDSISTLFFATNEVPLAETQLLFHFAEMLISYFEKKIISWPTSSPTLTCVQEHPPNAASVDKLQLLEH